jgi:hypothetical protein
VDDFVERRAMPHARGVVAEARIVGQFGPIEDLGAEAGPLARVLHGEINHLPVTGSETGPYGAIEAWCAPLAGGAEPL